MLGKTHLAVGIAASMAVLHPETPMELIAGLGASAVGAVISDIDVGTTDAHRDSDIITAIAVVSVIAVIALEKVFHLGIIDRIMRDSNMFRIVLGVLVFIGVCAVGKQTPHRSMMHSIAALVVLTGCIYTVFPMLASYFAVAFASHLITDLFNFKRVQLLYPIPGGICFKLFHAKGMANSVLLTVGGLVAVVEIGLQLIKMI